MKMLCSAITLALALISVSTAQASDKKIGNVIAVERTIENVYQTCIDEMKQNKETPTFASCIIDIKNTKVDFVQISQRVLTLADGGCEVEGTAQAGVILVSFQARGAKATVADSKACLRKAINASPTQDSFKFIVNTIE